ncbi:MAG: hypothetical protein WCJ35_08815 [Planctomycetota bacterium]
MAKDGNTYAKRQRETLKRQKAEAKRDRRQKRKDGQDVTESPPSIDMGIDMDTDMDHPPQEAVAAANVGS